MIWTQEKVDELIRLHAQGLPYRVIGKALGTNQSAISGKVSRLNLNGYGRDDRPRHRTTPRKYKTIERGDWDFKTFEPYAIRKQRLAKERDNRQAI